jgi:hypothetical protein
VLHGLLCLAPALVFALALLARRYPGERTLLAMRRRERPPLPRPARVARTSRPVRATLARGGRLIGRSLAVRPPPAALSAR